MAAVPSIVILLAAAFVPAIVFLIYIRNQEQHGREPWAQVLRAFVFGAIVSVLIALILEQLLHSDKEREYEILKQQIRVPATVFLVVIIAPLVEEFAKGLGVRGSKRHISEEEDGIVYGAAAGFGFAATENLFYELAALQQHGEAAFIATAVVRAITGNFLHATASGILGFGMGRMYRRRRTIFSLLPYFIGAVLLHALFNLVAVATLGAAVFVTVIFAFVSFRWMVKRIRRLDEIPEFIPGGPR